MAFWKYHVIFIYSWESRLAMWRIILLIRRNSLWKEWIWFILDFMSSQRMFFYYYYTHSQIVLVPPVVLNNRFNISVAVEIFKIPSQFRHFRIDHRQKEYIVLKSLSHFWPFYVRIPSLNAHPKLVFFILHGRVW